MRDHPTDGSPDEQPLSRRAQRERERERGTATTRDAGERHETDSAPDTGSILDEDPREYPELESEQHTTDQDGTPITVGPSSYGRGYQTITVNHDRPADPAKREARRQRRRRRRLMVLGAVGAFLVLMAGLSLALRAVLPAPEPEDYPGPGGDPVAFTVNQGEGPLSIGSRLVEQDIVSSQGAFLQAMNQSRSENEIQPGEYELREQMAAADAASVLLREGQERVHYVAINRGMRLNEAFQALSQATGLPVSDFEEAAQDPTAYGLPEQAPSLEGYLAPGEHRFPITAEPAEVLETLITPTFETLEELGIEDPQEQFRTVTIASILEAEALPDDYATVAGIIENRLQPNEETNGYLQIDATVIYGLGTRQLQFPESEKQNPDNEYNSYYYRGLPPGPIGAPSTEAIEAAANPEDNDYFYWITTNIETGETKFSTEYAQHQQYQQEYRQYCADNPEICGQAGNRAGDGASPETGG